MRITQKDLESVVNRINNLTSSPATPYRKVDGQLKANVGNYHVSYAYGGVSLHRMVNESGGVRDIFYGHFPKRDLYDRMQAFIKGWDARHAAQEEVTE